MSIRFYILTSLLMLAACLVSACAAQKPVVQPIIVSAVPEVTPVADPTPSPAEEEAEEPKLGEGDSSGDESGAEDTSHDSADPGADASKEAQFVLTMWLEFKLVGTERLPEERTLDAKRKKMEGVLFITFSSPVPNEQIQKLREAFDPKFITFAQEERDGKPVIRLTEKAPRHPKSHKYRFHFFPDMVAGIRARDKISVCTNYHNFLLMQCEEIERGRDGVYKSQTFVLTTTAINIQ